MRQTLPIIAVITTAIAVASVAAGEPQNQRSAIEAAARRAEALGIAFPLLADSKGKIREALRRMLGAGPQGSFLILLDANQRVLAARAGLDGGELLRLAAKQAGGRTARHDPHLIEVAIAHRIVGRPGDHDVVGFALAHADHHHRGLDVVDAAVFVEIEDAAVGILRWRGAHSLVTVSMSIDFIGSGQIGQWITVETDVIKTGRTLCFAQCAVRADGEIIARASATFRVVKKAA